MFAQVSRRHGEIKLLRIRFAPQPPNSPDLTYSYYFLFSILKKCPVGKKKDLTMTLLLKRTLNLMDCSNRILRGDSKD